MEFAYTFKPDTKEIKLDDHCRVGFNKTEHIMIGRCQWVKNDRAVQFWVPLKYYNIGKYTNADGYCKTVNEDWMLSVDDALILDDVMAQHNWIKFARYGWMSENLEQYLITIDGNRFKRTRITIKL